MQKDITKRVSLLPSHEQHTHSKPLKKGFRLIGPKDHEGNANSRRERHMKAAFTLIELIVVMAVLAILVLLAAPKFLNYTEKARASQVVNDIKTLETKLDEYLIRHEGLPESFTDATPGGGQLYDRTGPIDTAPDNLKVVDKTFYPESTLPGDFYTNDKGDVIYEDSGTPTEGGGVSAPDINKEFVLKPVTEEDKDKPLQGDGTEANPYRIWYLEHLKEIEGDMAGHYIVMRDLDFDNAESYLNPTENMPKWSQVSGATTGWAPIGKDAAVGAFSGYLDGNEFAIYNLFIDRTGQTDTDYFGLFTEYAGASATNLSLFKIYIKADWSGALFGEAYIESSESLTLKNISVSGEMHGDFNGGVFSEMYNSTNTIIKDINVKIVMDGSSNGGVFGSVYDSDNTVINNINSDVVMSGSSEMAGIGYAFWNANNVLAENLNIIARIEGNESAGGFTYLDKMTNTTIRNVDIDAEINGNVVAGFVYSVIADSINMEFITGNAKIMTNEGAGLIYYFDAGWNDNLGKLSDVDLNIDIQTLNENEYYEVIGGLVSVLGEVSVERVTVTGHISMHSNKDGTLLSETNGLSGNRSVGGIFGTGYDFTLFNDVTYNGDINATGVGDYKVLSVGGLGGDVSYDIFALLDGVKEITPVTNVTVNGSVQTNGFLVGGLLGRAEHAYITHSIKDAGIVSGDKYVGGVIGRIDHTYEKYDYDLKKKVTYMYSAPENTNVSSLAEIVANEHYGDIVGYTVTIE